MATNVAQLHDAAKRGALTDGLTGLANHRAFYEALDTAVAMGELFTVGLFDVAGLKLVNDTIGHLAGDAILRGIAETLRESVRDTDTVARYGGDEFGLIMVDAGEDEAIRVAALVRRQMSKRPVHAHGPRQRYGSALPSSRGMDCVHSILSRSPMRVSTGCADRPPGTIRRLE